MFENMFMKKIQNKVFQNSLRDNTPIIKYIMDDNLETISSVFYDTLIKLFNIVYTKNLYT